MNGHNPTPTANTIVSLGIPPAVTYLNTVRWTITTLDGLRLTAVNFATLGAAGTLAAAATAYFYATKNPETIEPNLAGIAVASCAACFVITSIFMAKVWMFDRFIGYAVSLALSIETEIGLSDDFGITHKFEQHTLAGKNGWIYTWTTFVFFCLISLTAIFFGSYILGKLTEGNFTAHHSRYLWALGAFALFLLAPIAYILLTKIRRLFAKIRRGAHRHVA
jgi:hypothetical protein